MTISALRPIVIIESPYAARDGVSVAEHKLYLQRCLRDSWTRGELPFASHGFFPLFLSEDDDRERQAGIEAGYRFWHHAEALVLYTDYGISKGMIAAVARVHDLSKSGATYKLLSVWVRFIGKNAPNIEKGKNDEPTS